MHGHGSTRVTTMQSNPAESQPETPICLHSLSLSLSPSFSLPFFLAVCLRACAYLSQCFSLSVRVRCVAAWVLRLPTTHPTCICVPVPHLILSFSVSFSLSLSLSLFLCVCISPSLCVYKCVRVRMCACVFGLRARPHPTYLHLWLTRLLTAL